MTDYRKAWLTCEAIIDRIHELMDGKLWSPDTLDAIAQVLESNGHLINPPEEVE